MTNDEALMTKECPKVSMPNSGFSVRHSLVIRIYELVIFSAAQSANNLVPLIQAANSCRTPGDLAH
jgi:hypothetical protein